MPLPFSFSNNTAPTGPQLDSNFAAVGALTIIPCTISGTNSLTLAPATNTPTINAYANYLRVSGVAVATNTGATTAQFGALAALPVYRDTPGGVVALAGGEIVINCAFTLIYDSALNSGNGGWHLVSVANALPYTGTVTNASLSFVSGTLSTLNMSGGSLSTPILAVGGGASITRILSGVGTIAYTVVPAATAQDQTMTLSGVKLGDSVALGYTVSQTNATFGAFVPANGTITVRCLNAGAASISAFTLVARATAQGFT